MTENGTAPELGDSIYLYDDKVLITFNYKEGTETVTFGEATESEKVRICVRKVRQILDVKS